MTIWPYRNLYSNRWLEILLLWKSMANFQHCGSLWSCVLDLWSLFFLRDYVDCCCSVSCAAGSMLFAYCKYEHWLAKKLNPYVVSYQSDHNLENLKQGLDRWRPWAFSKHSKNIITANWFSALLDQQRWTEAEETLEQFLHRAKIRRIK